MSRASARARGARALRIAVLGMLFAAVALGTATASASPLLIGSGNQAKVDARPGEVVTVTGSVTSSFDGAVFDAATTTISDETRNVGLLKLDGSGFRLAAHNPITHRVELVATGEDAPACREAGLGEGPCFLDGTDVLAHERLLTVAEFGGTLRGNGAALDVTLPKHARPLVAPLAARRLAWLSTGVAFAMLAFFSWRRVQQDRASLLGQVRRLAKEALAKSHGDATLSGVRAEIDELVARADVLDRARRTASERLSRIDRKLLEAKRATWSRSASPASQGAAHWLSTELAEADRLAADHAAAVAGLQQIVSALRVVSLASREGRNLAAIDPTQGALANVARELTLRDDALLEAERDAMTSLSSSR